MDVSELRGRIQSIAQDKLGEKPDILDVTFPEFKYLPELQTVIRELLTSQYDLFISSIDFVAPRPTTFRINLKNDEEFYLLWDKRSWTAQVEGKKYYLLNISEEQHAAEAISRILRYGMNIEDEEEEEGFDSDNEFGGGEDDFGGGEPIEEPIEEPEL